MRNERAVPAVRMTDWLDRAAVTASFACLVHCLALPLLIAALPTLSRVLAIPESFHLWVLLFAIPASSLALLGGRARHRVGWPLLVGMLGLLLLAAAALVFASGGAETPVTVTGSVALTIAHFGNWRLRHSCVAA